MHSLRRAWGCARSEWFTGGGTPKVMLKQSTETCQWNEKSAVNVRCQWVGNVLPAGTVPRRVLWFPLTEHAVTRKIEVHSYLLMDWTLGNQKGRLFIPRKISCFLSGSHTVPAATQGFSMCALLLTSSRSDCMHKSSSSKPGAIRNDSGMRLIPYQ